MIPEGNPTQCKIQIAYNAGKIARHSWAVVRALHTVARAFAEAHCRRWRPYRVECTGSLPTSEVKRRRARLVLGWGTAREVLRVLTAFASRRPVFQLPPRMTTIMLPTFRANALLLARPRVSSFQVDALFQVASCSPGGSLINAVPDASCKAPPSLKSNPKPSNSHPATSQCRIIRWPHASGEAKAM